MQSNAGNIIEKYINAPVNEETIQAFVGDLYDQCDLLFHADDDFNDYVNEEGQPTFNKIEAGYLNQILDKMWDYCQKKGIDIHEVLEGTQQQSFGKKGIPHPLDNPEGIEETEELNEFADDDNNGDPYNHDGDEGDDLDPVKDWLEGDFADNILPKIVGNTELNEVLTGPDVRAEYDYYIDNSGTDASVNIAVPEEVYNNLINDNFDKMTDNFQKAIDGANLYAHANIMSSDPESGAPGENEFYMIHFHVQLPDHYE